MKNCPHCGKQLHDEASFCIYCMRRLAAVNDVKSENKKKSGKNIVIALLSVICAALTVGMLLVLRESRLEADSYEQTISERDCIISDYDEKMAAVMEQLIPSAEDEYIQGCNQYINLMSVYAEKLRYELISYDQDHIVPANRLDEFDSSYNIWTHFTQYSGDVHIQYSSFTDRVKCVVLNVPGNLEEYRTNHFRLMQLLFSTLTDSLETEVYEFVSDNEKYPFTDEDAEWKNLSDYSDYWINSVVDENTKVRVMRKDGEFEGMRVYLIVRSRQYGQTVFYDYYFEVY